MIYVKPVISGVSSSILLNDSFLTTDFQSLPGFKNHIIAGVQSKAAVVVFFSFLISVVFQ